MHGLNGCCREAGCGKQWLFPYSRCPQSRLIQNHPLQSRQERQAIGFAHGQYILPEAFPDELYLWQQRTGKMIYLHETALFLHDISERTPPKLTATVPSTLAGSVKVYYGKPDLFELGAVLRPSKLGHQVRAYDLERTILEILRSRSRVDAQLIFAALKLYTFFMLRISINSENTQRLSA